MMRGWAIALLMVLGATTLEAIDRPYDREPTMQDRADIHYIVDGLADRHWSWLLTHVGTMKRAGDRIESVHPLRFLQVVFTDEKLKVSMKKVASKGGRYWTELMGGLKRSLAEEQGKGNLTIAQVSQFAELVGIPPGLIGNSIVQARWDEMVWLLIQNVPRAHAGNHLEW
jgi:hypothetical protein